ncbi:MAG: ABC transporter substrate-binding protein [Acidimicrobiales bacterium]|nr:MAG: ABC transporter substrate-binding protein [Acidimicrobiales bacterium]
MLRLTLRNLAARKARFAMTTFAVVLGVGFVVASFVMSDGLRSTFDGLSEDITAGTDLLVRPTSEFGEPTPLDESLVEQVIAIDGVDNAVAYIESDENEIQPIKADGSTITTSGPPQITFAWMEDTSIGTFTIVEGRAPLGPDEFSMDLDAAARHDFVVGETYDVITPSGVWEDVELTATTRFGEDNTTVGATLMQVSLEEAQRLFGEPGSIDQVPLSLEDGADADAVMADIQTLLGGASAEIVDQATVTAEQQAEFDEGVTIIGNVLLGFAIISLFVSIFIIYNTFAIVLGQRVREMGLLRAIGADAAQLRRSVLGEAVIVGVVASLIGLVAGVGIAALLNAVFEALGAQLPDYPTILATRTIVFALILGVGVTVVSSIAPARAAASVSPIEALRDGGAVTPDDGRRRLTVGGTTLGAGFGLGALGLFGPSLSTMGLILTLGLAAVMVFLGLTLASPAVARPLTGAIGWPLSKVMGTAGELARGNASRNPRRTATTAAALMIGLSLVTMGYVVGESVKTSLGNLIAQSVTADYVIAGNEDNSGISPALADELAATGQFSAVTGMRYDEARLGSDVREVTALDLGTIDELFDIDLQAGTIPDSEATDVILLHDELAADLGVGVGDTVPIEFAGGMTADLEVSAIYADKTIFEDPLVPDQVFDDGLAATTDEWIAASLPDGISTADVAPLLAQLQATYPQVDISTTSEFQQSFEDTIDSALLVVNALLALAIVIALIGIANTLALSVHERTREIGLLRAVGMTRRQTRRMIRWEAVLVALFGAVLGVAAGTVFGWGIVQALPQDSFGGSLTIPVAPIIQVVVLAALATLVAAWLPARRAGKLDVLDAISH